jgi:hypothetical protein
MIGRLPGFGGGWTRGRDLPPLAATSFRERWRQTHGRNRADKKKEVAGEQGHGE